MNLRLCFCLICFIACRTMFGQAPLITSFSPQSGPIGTSVTITGTGFNTTADLNNVNFGATRATVTAASATSLTVTVPIGATYERFWVTNLATNLTAYSAKLFMVTQPGGFTYIHQQRFDIPGLPGNVALSDFDNDGKSDLAVPNDQSMLIFRNNGTPGTVSFEDPLQVGNESGFHTLGIGDLDGDGKSDMVTSTSDGTLMHHLNTTTPGGGISFSSSPGATEATCYSISIADLDGDGKPDYAGSFGSTGFYTYRNESTPGNITFAAPQKIRPNNNTNSILRLAAGDLDGDRKPDLVAFNLTTDILHIYRNISTVGSITLAPKVDFPLVAGANIRHIFIGDLDGDDKPDLALSNYFTNNISIYRNTSTVGSISFDARIEFPVGGSARTITECDLDGDGKADLIVPQLRHIDGRRMAILRNISTVGSMNFEAPQILSGLPTPFFAAAGDLDGDMKPDIVVSNGFESVSSRTVSVFRQYTPVVISSFSPSAGCAGIGTAVITGSGFERTTSVTIGGTPVLNFTVDSPTQITATVGSGASGAIAVTADNTGTSAGTFTVNNNPTQPVAINGDAAICVGVTKTYSIAAVSSATSYTWTLPSGWTGTSITNSIEITSGATSGSVSVIANNACGVSPARILPVLVNAIPSQPGLISGDVVLCSGESETYGITSVVGATNYTWTLPTGWTGTSTSNAINTTVNSTNENISVTANNMCGSSPANTLTVTVNSIPNQPGTINGDVVPCAGDSETYGITSVVGATNYTWTLPTGWTGTSTSNAITTTVNPTNENISVTANNMCGSSPAKTLTVAVNTIPDQPGSISGDATLCAGDSETYEVAIVSGATSYTWTLPVGWTGASTSNAINTTVNPANENISVTANNMCGSSPAKTLTVTVNIIPDQPGSISGDATLCAGDSETYEVAVVSGATSYTWTLPNGWTGTSTTSTIDVTAGTVGGEVFVKSSNSCGSSREQRQVVNVTFVSKPSITLHESDEGYTLTSDSDRSNQWFVDEEAIAGATEIEYFTITAGVYKVHVTMGSCTSELSDGIEINNRIWQVFLPNLFTPNGNSVNDSFRVRAAGVEQIQFAIYDVSGHEVYNTTDVIEATETGWDGKYKGNDAPTGTYTWTLKGRYIGGESLTNNKNRYGQVLLMR